MKEKKRIGIIIYARTSSKRLPNKVLNKINKKTLLETVYLRAKKNLLNLPIVVNTSTHRSDNRIVSYCKKKK